MNKLKDLTKKELTELLLRYVKAYKKLEKYYLKEELRKLPLRSYDKTSLKELSHKEHKSFNHLEHNTHLNPFYSRKDAGLFWKCSNNRNTYKLNMKFRVFKGFYNSLNSIVTTKTYKDELLNYKTLKIEVIKA